MSEPRPSQGVESIVAQHQHLQIEELAEGVICEGGTGYVVVLQQQCPQLCEAIQGIFLNILDAVPAQGEQSKIEQERQICPLQRGEVSIGDNENPRGHRGCCREEKHRLDAGYL